MYSYYKEMNTSDQDISMIANWKKVGENGSWKGFIQFPKENKADARFETKEDCLVDTNSGSSWYNPFSWFYSS